MAEPVLVEVHLLGIPVAKHARTSEHSDELMREFTLLRAQTDGTDPADVPARLLQLMDDLNVRFAAFTSASRAELDAAIENGTERLDLTYRVPVDVAPACEELNDLLDEADRFCLAGEHLLTLATPDDLVRYRRWFLREFVRQLSGNEPRTWSES